MAIDTKRRSVGALAPRRRRREACAAATLCFIGAWEVGLVVGESASSPSRVGGVGVALWVVAAL